MWGGTALEEWVRNGREMTSKVPYLRRWVRERAVGGRLSSTGACLDVNRAQCDVTGLNVSKRVGIYQLAGRPPSLPPRTGTERKPEEVLSSPKQRTYSTKPSRTWRGQERSRTHTPIQKGIWVLQAPVNTGRHGCYVGHSMHAARVGDGAAPSNARAMSDPEAQAESKQCCKHRSSPDRHGCYMGRCSAE